MENSRVGAFRGRGLLVAGLIAAGFVSYQVLRAVKVSLTFDEADTHMTYLSSGPFGVFDLRSTNNHFLNTLLAWPIAAVAGASELSLRIPSLLGYFLYLGFSWALLKRYLSRGPALAGFLLLNLNPFVMDYFSLSRGYGLALGFEMGALYYFLAFLDPPRPGDEEQARALWAALLLAWVSALANLSFLNVLLALWIFALLFFLIKNRAESPERKTEASPGLGWALSKSTVVALALAVPFNLVVIGQCLRLSETSTDPISVRVLESGPAGSIQVFGADIYGNQVPFPPNRGGWLIPRNIAMRRLMLGFSRPALDALTGVEIRIGPRRLEFSRSEMLGWRRRWQGAARYFLFEPSPMTSRSIFPDLNGVVNWREDRVFFRALAREAGGAFVILALILAAIYGSGLLTARLRLLRIAQLKPLCAVAALSVLYLLYPIYAMEENRMFYYGGPAGFIKTTVYSLIGNSFYGRHYLNGQESFVFLFMAAIAVLTVFWLGRRIQKKDIRGGPVASLPLLVIVIVALLNAAQKAILGTPYVMGRTAIFFIPLAVLMLLFALGEAWRASGVWRAGAASILVVVVALSAFHWTRTANFTHTLDCAPEADTKLMIRDVAALKDREFPACARVRLGVDWHFWPSSVYYQRRAGLSWLEVYMIPTPWNCDLYYVSYHQPLTELNPVIKRYARTGNVLVR